MAIANVIGVSHVARETSDSRRLIQFYKEILGYEEADMRGIVNCNETMKIMWLNHPLSVQIHIIERFPPPGAAHNPILRSATIPKTEPPSDHIAFSVSNFNSALEKLKEKGIETSIFTTKRENGDVIATQAFFLDPDGNLLEITNDREVTPQQK